MGNSCCCQMKQLTFEEFFEMYNREVPVEGYNRLTDEQKLALYKGQNRLIGDMQKLIEELRKKAEQAEQRSLLVEQQIVHLQSRIFSPSSEKSVFEKPPKEAEENIQTDPKPKRDRILLPSERYPNALRKEINLTLEKAPECRCCGHQMSDSGLTEDSEYLTVIPKKFVVVIQKRHKYCCDKCHGDLVTTPALPRIKEGSAYSDEMIIDVAMSKYCDLIPIERYSKMAGREGFMGIPPNSLIETTHYLAEITKEAYEELKKEVTSSKVLHADETPHRMLEGSKTNSWYFWGFSTKKTSYFECHPTRSGDVGIEFLRNSQCEYLVSDVYSGYNKTIRETNTARALKKLPPIFSAFCNSHARRYFYQAQDNYKEAKEVVDIYREIYIIESQLKDKNPEEQLLLRQSMIPLFEQIRDGCQKILDEYPRKSQLGKAMNYFLKNYDGLTRFTKNIELPIDNNAQERLLRSYVVGRKTWLGTHSKLGAKTSAILFSLVESCKLNHVNPREYFKSLVEDIHQGLPSYTPKVYAEKQAAGSAVTTISI